MIEDRRRYRKIFIRLWKNPDFRALPYPEKAMTLYLLSGPQTNRIGLFQVSFGAASEDLGESPVMLRKRLEKVVRAFGWEFDAIANVLWIPSWWDFNSPSGNENNTKGALSDLDEVPSTPLIPKFASHLTYIPHRLHKYFSFVLERHTAKTLSGHRRDTVRTQEQEQEQEKEQEQEQDSSSATSAEPLMASIPVLTFPTVGAGGSTWQLSEAQLAEWATLFPHLDVLGEARKAKAWVVANQGRQKTAKGMPKFLVGWLTRATDTGRGHASAGAVAGRTDMLRVATEEFLK